MRVMMSSHPCKQNSSLSPLKKWSLLCFLCVWTRIKMTITTWFTFLCVCSIPDHKPNVKQQCLFVCFFNRKGSSERIAFRWHFCSLIDHSKHFNHSLYSPLYTDTHRAALFQDQYLAGKNCRKRLKRFKWEQMSDVSCTITNADVRNLYVLVCSSFSAEM